MYCTNCGTKLNDYAQFCHICGCPVPHSVNDSPVINNSPVINKAKTVAKSTFAKIDTFLKEQGVINDTPKKSAISNKSTENEKITIVHPTFGFAISFVISILILLGFIVHFLVRLAKSNFDVFMPVIVLISLVLLLCLMMFMISLDQDHIVKFKKRYSKFNSWIRKNSDSGILIVFIICVVDFFLGIIVLIQALT